MKINTNAKCFLALLLDVEIKPFYFYFHLHNLDNVAVIFNSGNCLPGNLIFQNVTCYVTSSIF